MNEVQVLTHSRFRQLIAQAKEQWAKLSKREQGILAAGLAFVIFMCAYWIYVPVSEGFQAVEKRFADAQVRARATGGALERYLKLRARKDAIESRYREVEFKEGALSHLENLIRNKAGIASGFTIKDGQPRAFSGGYEQLPISIKFSTTNVPALVDFLKEVVHGSRPLILSRLDISKPRRGDRLEVDIDVSSLRKSDNSKSSQTPEA